MIFSANTILHKELFNIKQTLVNYNFPKKLVNQQIKLYFYTNHNNDNNNNNTNRINLYCSYQRQKKYKLDKKEVTDIIHRHINRLNNQKK